VNKAESFYQPDEQDGNGLSSPGSAVEEEQRGVVTGSLSPWSETASRDKISSIFPALPSHIQTQLSQAVCRAKLYNMP